MKKSVLLLFLFSLALQSVFAQINLPKGTEIHLSGNFKTLAEYRQGYKNILSQDASPAYVISQRSRLILDFISPKFDLRFSAQDTRAWGESYVVNTTVPILIYEAWVKYHFNRNLGLKIGRQVITYGDKRIFAERNWSMQGASHDALLLNYSKNKLVIDFGLALNNNNTKMLEETPYLINNYKSMSWLWISKKFNQNFSFNFIELLGGYQNTNTLTTYGLNTIGGNPVITLSDFTLNSSIYFQHGKNKNGNTHRAHLYTFNLSYTQPLFRAKAGYDNYSGKEYSDSSTTDRYFVQIMETIPHAFLGFMDFVKGSQFQKQYGISDLNFYLQYGKQTTFTAYFHALAYAAKPGENLSKKIGNEFDFVLTHKFYQGLSLNIGYSFMLPGKDFEISSLGYTPAAFAQWGWAMLVFKPQLL